jgi:hypothetical protein
VWKRLKGRPNGSGGDSIWAPAVHANLLDGLNADDLGSGVVPAVNLDGSMDEFAGDFVDILLLSYDADDLGFGKLVVETVGTEDEDISWEQGDGGSVR